MEIIRIKKRDGSVVEFRKEKIKIAMEKAALAINPAADLRPYDIIADHAVRHIEMRFPTGIPDVETVQDLVERTLMEYGLFDIAKAYILYRAERAKQRGQKIQETSEKVEKARLSYADLDGQLKPLDRKKLTNYFKEASVGVEAEVDLALLTQICEGNIFDGIGYAELGKALVLSARSLIERDPAYSQVAARLELRNLYNEVMGPVTPAKFDTTYRQAFIANLKESVVSTRLLPELLEFDLEGLAEYLKPERDGIFEYMGIQILHDRYFLREEGEERRLESPQAFWMRIAMGLALGEGEQKNAWARKFYDIMSQLYYVPSTPTLFHAGTAHPQLSSCYLNTVSDDLHQIFKVYGDNAQLAKYSGGVGTDWTNVRATGALVKSINLASQGVIPYLRIANDVCNAINRSGKRRGAAAAYLESWHYDIEDFLDLRRNTGDERRRTHDINTANWVPDLFMKRVNEGAHWTLFSPEEVPELHHLYGKAFEKKYVEYEKKAERGELHISKRIQARDLWRKMVTMLFETGHPWITFKDSCNVRSPQDHAGIIHNSNLCTEITLNNSEDETAVCNLGSINMARHIRNGKVNTELLKETTHLAMRMLDNVIDLTFYPTVEGKNSNMRHRPVGLGLMGFQDALYELDIDFDSEQAVQFADENMEFISYHAILASANLAKEKGTYESYKGSKWDRGIFPVDTLDLLEAERGMPIGVSRAGKLDWKPVREAVKKYGMRNSNNLAIAPTATISYISGCQPCIEPIYQNLFVRTNMSGEFTIANQYLVNDLKRLGLWNETMLEELKAADGSVQDITLIPPRLRNKYKTVFEIAPHHQIKIAAYRAKWIDQSQSLNIFFKGTSGKALADVYMHAWHLGLKTTYYLRSLAASSIEKSTLDINKWNKRLPEPVPVPLAVEGSSILTVGITENMQVISDTTSRTPVNVDAACRIDDPTCESCQ